MSVSHSDYPSSISPESHDEHADMNHSGSAEMPEGLEEAANPEFETGSKVTIKADHMKGMDGAEGMVTGARKLGKL